MRRVLTTVLAVALLLGLGALAVLALPNGSAPLAGAPAVSAAAPEFQDAPLATQNYNLLAMPLNSTNQFTSAGLGFNADGLASLIGTGAKQVLRWNASTQLWEARLPEFQDGPNFALEVGGVYFVLVDSTVGNVVSFVGDVPAQGSVHYNLLGAANCKFNTVMVPLDRSDITTADQLATAIGNVEQVLNWNASTQLFETRLPAFQDGPNFTVKIGYPYGVCMTVDKVWP
jgi:hypothetical protein